MFAVDDIPWVARTVGHCMRVTLDEKTFEEIQKQRTDIDRDAVYAPDGGAVRTHLLFKWQENSSGRLVGHFDLLYPRQGPVAMLLASDVSRFCYIYNVFLEMKRERERERKKNAYIFIYIIILYTRMRAPSAKASTLCARLDKQFADSLQRSDDMPPLQDKAAQSYLLIPNFRILLNIFDSLDCT